MSSRLMLAAACVAWTGGFALLVVGSFDDSPALRAWGIYTTAVAVCTTVHQSVAGAYGRIDRRLTKLEKDAYERRIGQQESAGVPRQWRQPRQHG